MTQPISNLDAESTQYLHDELTRLASVSIEKKYPELNFRRIFPINHEGSPADEFIKFHIYDAVGLAKIIAAYADDLPRSDVSVKEVIFPVRTIGTSFGYSIMEILAAQQAGKPLAQRKMDTCVKAVEQTFHSIAWNGDATSGLLGFFTTPNIPVVTVVDPGAGTEWINKTPLQILNDVNSLFSAQDVATKQLETSQVLCLAPAQWNYIAGTPMSADSDKSIMQYLITNSPWLNGANSIQKVRELAGKGTGGADMMFIYNPSPEKLEMWITAEINFLEPEPDNLTMKVAAWARCGGLHVYYPLSIYMAEGI